MTKRAIVAATVAATVGLSGVAVTSAAHADGIFSDMNPFNWFFGRDRDYYYDRDYWHGPHRWGGPYGWAGGPYAWSGAWGYPGYARPQTLIVVAGEAEQESTQVAAAHLPE